MKKQRLSGDDDRAHAEHVHDESVEVSDQAAAARVSKAQIAGAYGGASAAKGNRAHNAYSADDDQATPSSEWVNWRQAKDTWKKGKGDPAVASGNDQKSADDSFLDDDERRAYQLEIVGFIATAETAFISALKDVQGHYREIARKENEFKGVFAQVALGFLSPLLAKGIAKVLGKLKGTTRTAINNLTKKRISAPARTGGIQSDPLFAIANIPNRTDALAATRRQALTKAAGQVRGVLSQGGRWTKHYVQNLAGWGEVDDFLATIEGAHQKHSNAIITHVSHGKLSDTELLAYRMAYDDEVMNAAAFRTALKNLGDRYQAQVEPVGTTEHIHQDGRPRGQGQEKEWELHAALIWKIELPYQGNGWAHGPGQQREERKSKKTEALALVKSRKVNLTPGFRPHVGTSVEFVSWIDPDLQSIAIAKEEKKTGRAVPKYEHSFVKRVDWGAKNSPLRRTNNADNVLAGFSA